MGSPVVLVVVGVVSHIQRIVVLLLFSHIN